MPTPTQNLLEGLFGGLGPNYPLTRQAALLGGHEDDLFLYGARDFPLAALLARPLLGAARAFGVEAERLGASESVSVVLATRGETPNTFQVKGVGEDARTAIYSATVAVDGEEFFLGLEGEGSNTLWRSVRVAFGAPEAAFSAWDVSGTPWAKTGFVSVVYGLVAQGDALVAEQFPLVLARWGEREQPGVATIPATLGCEQMDLVLGWIPAGSGHPLRALAERAGLTREEQHVLALVAQPVLDGLALESEGPNRNNVHAADLEKLVSSCNTPYAWACRGVAVRTMEMNPVLAEGGSLREVALGLLGAVEPLTKGEWVGDEPQAHVPHLTAGLEGKLASVIAGWLTLRPAHGAAIVGEVRRLQEEGRRIWLGGGLLPDQAPYLELVEMTDSGELETASLLGA